MYLSVWKLLTLVFLAGLYYSGSPANAMDPSAWEYLHANIFLKGGPKMEPDDTLYALRQMKSIFDFIKRDRSELWNASVKDLYRSTNDLIRFSYVIPENCRELYLKKFKSIKDRKSSENLRKYLEFYFNEQVKVCKEKNIEILKTIGEDGDN